MFLDWTKEATEYFVDAAQRTMLFWDIMRERGNIYLDRKTKKGKTDPVLAFKYDVILDGRTFDRPVNYGLLRIKPPDGVEIDPRKRPIVVVDPRAGHGPGIGGSKRDSQVGMAMKYGHPVYFIGFVSDPVPDQTLADVKDAQARFIEKVARRHPDCEESPAVIGNCQAGWAMALLSADRPEITGPLMLNGAPMSFWAGEAGTNPMRVAGALTGGAWLVSLLSDLGNGVFDGAYLVTNFETLNLANTLWTKQYNVYSKVDKEKDRYLNFEKWWNDYFMMESDEIHFIVEKLFLGNELEQGTLKLDKGKTIDLKNIDEPVVIFSSAGDEITPPAQALNWIANVYGSVEEIERRERVVVYLLDRKIGHLGIFVSGRIARKQHQELIKYVDVLDFFPPGLYEMIIEEGESIAGVTDYRVRYEERTMEDIHEIVGTDETEPHFRVVSEVSDLNDKIYKAYFRPWVQLFTTPASAELLKQTNPARMTRYWFSDRNPFTLPIRQWGEWVKKHRKPVSSENRFLEMEKLFSRTAEDSLEKLQSIRDGWQAFLFEAIYGNPFLEWFLVGNPADVDAHAEAEQERRKQLREREANREYWLKKIDQGGFPEGVVRAIFAIAWADMTLTDKEVDRIRKLVQSHSTLRLIGRRDLKRIAREQSRILQTDFDAALDALPKLLPPSDLLKEVVMIAEEIGFSHGERSPKEIEIARRIRELLNLDSLMEEEDA